MLDLALELTLLARGVLGEGRRAVLEELLLPVVEEARVDVVLLADLRDLLLLDQDLAQDGHLLVGRVLLPRLLRHVFLHRRISNRLAEELQFRLRQDNLPWLLNLFLRMPVTALALSATLFFLAVRAARPGAAEPSRRVLLFFKVSRRVLGVIMMGYAAVKFSGLQLPHNNIQPRLVTEMPPSDLFWYFYGYSRGYVIFIAIAELLAGVLLFVPRTERLGLLVTAAVLANIVALDFFFEVGHVAWFASALLVSCVANLLFELPLHREVLTLLMADRRVSSRT